MHHSPRWKSQGHVRNDNISILKTSRWLGETGLRGSTTLKSTQRETNLKLSISFVIRCLSITLLLLCIIAMNLKVFFLSFFFRLLQLCCNIYAVDSSPCNCLHVHCISRINLSFLLEQLISHCSHQRRPESARRHFKCQRSEIN